MYILECVDGSYYTGSTINLEKRLWQHQNGEGANYTQKRLPVKLIYCEPYDRVEDAFNREKQVQGWSHRKKQALITGNYDDLIVFSKNYTEYGSQFSEPADPFLELVEGNTDVSQDPAAASTGSASAYIVASENLIQPSNKPLPEPVEGCGVQEERNQVEALPELVEENATVSLDPAMASTGSASAYIVAGTALTQPTNKPLPEPVEGCGGQDERKQVETLSEPTEDNADVPLDPAMASTGSAAAYMVDGETLTLPPTSR